MRILLVGVAVEGGGAERVTTDLATGFVEHGHEVMIGFLEGTDRCVPELEARGIACRRSLRREQLTSHPLADLNPSCILAFRRLIREFRPDILHAHVPRATLWASAACRTVLRRPRFVYTEHSVQDIYPRWARWVYRAFLPLVDRVICVSDAARESFSARWPRYAALTTRVWNGIRSRRMAPNVPRDELRTALGVGPDAPVLCNVANVTAHKAQEVLVRAVVIARRQHPELRCWIAGGLHHEPATVEALRAAIRSHDLEGSVELLGPRADVPDLLSAADLFVLSSRQEGFPITILEAMAAGRPVVATRVGGCAEAVLDGRTGLVVPPDDPDELAGAILRVLADPGLAEAMGEAGRARVQAEFTVERMVERHLSVYAQLLPPEVAAQPIPSPMPRDA